MNCFYIVKSYGRMEV